MTRRNSCGTTRTRVGQLLVGGLAAFMAMTPSKADAGGLYFTDRGVRAMGRAGAFVAGADDLSAAWYNPAGLVEAGTSVMLDLSYLHHSVTYQLSLIHI